MVADIRAQRSEASAAAVAYIAALDAHSRSAETDDIAAAADIEESDIAAADAPEVADQKLAAAAPARSHLVATDCFAPDC